MKYCYEHDYGWCEDCLKKRGPSVSCTDECPLNDVDKNGPLGHHLLCRSCVLLGNHNAGNQRPEAVAQTQSTIDYQI